MSDTDDTDELLLIPPDLFVIDSEFEEPYVSAPYYSIVDTLITQVNQLENRINYIANTPDIPFTNEFHEYSSMSRERNYIHPINDDVSQNDYIPSTQSTPQKPRTIFKLNSLPPSPSARRFSPNRTKYGNRKPSPNKQMYNGDDSSVNQDQSEKMKLLNEIDNFISNVRSNNRLGVSRNLENNYHGNKANSLNIKEVYALLDDMEASISNNPQKFNRNIANVNMLTATSVSDMNASTSELSAAHGDSASDHTGVSSSDITQIEIGRNANVGSKSTNAYGDTMKATRMHQEVFNCHKINQNIALEKLKVEAENRRLLSLTDLWGQYSTEDAKNHYMGKLEEERLRRKVSNTKICG